MQAGVYSIQANNCADGARRYYTQLPVPMILGMRMCKRHPGQNALYQLLRANEMTVGAETLAHVSPAAPGAAHHVVCDQAPPHLVVLPTEQRTGADWSGPRQPSRRCCRVRR